MRIARIRISNFRCIKEADIIPSQHNVLLGPNNTGKTAVLEALNLVLNPEVTAHSQAIDENDFFRRNYLPITTAAEPPTGHGSDPAQSGMAPSAEADGQPPTLLPKIRIEAVLTDLDSDDQDCFRDTLVPWRDRSHEVVDGTPEGEDPFQNAMPAIRVVFEGWYDPQEDDFFYATFFLPSAGMDREDCPTFHREHKRQIGFLIYRDFRALTRPITLDPTTLFSRLLHSQDVIPKHFEDVLARLDGALDPMTSEADFASILNSYKAELERFLSLSGGEYSALSFELSDRTRSQVKQIAQLHVHDEIALPVQNMGAGTRSLSILAILTLIMRRRGRGILALEEPETFLFPHAQRRVIDECIALANQTFVTTHSPYVLERIPVDGVGRIERRPNGLVSWTPLSTTNVKQVNLYSKRLRHSFCEALLGRGVVVVEGDSDRWWIYGASRILTGKDWNGKRQEALELQGIAVVSADSNGDIPKTTMFFAEAGLKAVAVVDRVDDMGLIGELCGAPHPTLFLRQVGLETVLAEQLPIDLVRKILKETPHSRDRLLDPAVVSAMSDPDARAACREMLIRNKGSASMHEWILALIDETTLPPTLG